VTDPRVLARHFLDLGRHDRALDALEGAEPCNAEWFLLRSHASREIGDAAGAVDAAEAGLRLDPASVELLAALADAAAADDDLVLAERAILAALEHVPESPVFLAVYAQLAACDLQLEKADALLARARAVDTEDDTVAEVEAWYAYARGDRRRAAAAARRLLARDPDSELAHTILGGLAWSRGVAATASRHLDAAVRADPARSPVVEVAREARVEAADPFLRGLYRIDRLWFWALALGLLFATPFVPFLAVVTVPVLLLAVGVALYSWFIAPTVRKNVRDGSPPWYGG
jgi:predicted Zn-dependent protease